MKNKIVKYIKEIVVFIIVMILFANLLSIYRSQELNKDPLGISTFKLLNNDSYAVPKDKPILIHFWATWCPTCRAEASNIQSISKRYSVITIAYKSGSDSEIEEYIMDKNFNFNVVNDYDGKIGEKFGVSIFPTTIIYDKNGNEAFSEVGYTSTIGLWLRMWWIGI
ncbi:MAG: thioredoxin [Sulfurimonas sp. RIFOXYD12_FULL_33_39]|uniref:redoxin domain-containing protein n=1 Tax=unclassified Sulfurimonas TaxID=2623549 RepID=UPI0008B34F32|nr:MULTISPECIES: redoxin domain-containing protein [unclassified Sulfurimonas]OHE07240.1 MAG: thioredoxin [Sulfurimonas sp. RIFCSPLOWO2_12_FULL_34_6]OHE08765.1 MAG: thioredoxin [Sulfurimonas sp. RIFOXYD12_FULL_33_39]OHE14050.1 MAG: thioredoxin [Sulfurimonas sp. RIFOXYD2_FULL_34_21]